jgi:hypothetical protein
MKQFFALALASTVATVAVPLSPAVASTAAATFTVTLSGGVEVPPGDPDGRGSAQVSLRDGQLCFSLSDVSGVAPVTAGHIHRGGPGVAGPVVVPLIDDPEGLPTEQQFSSEQRCVDADAAVLDEIRNGPGQFYVNLHNAEFPGGAIRGQLTAGSLPFTGRDATGFSLLGVGLTAAGGALLLAARRGGPAAG